MSETAMRAIATFGDVPRELNIYDGRTGSPVSARYTSLTRKMCRDKIDKKWWSAVQITRPIRRGEPDHAWLWADKFGEVQADFRGHMQALGVETSHDSVLQGALLYATNSSSMLEEVSDGSRPPAVWIAYLATAPWNRSRVMEPDSGRYNGVGSALLKMAITHSYFRQGEGRVNLSAVSHPDTLSWYEQKGFVRCNDPEEERILLELPASAARRHLRKWGLQ